MALLKRIRDTGAAVHIVLLGGNSPLEQHMKTYWHQHAPLPFQDYVGATTLTQLAALLERMHVLVAPDTGPVHLANAMGTPIVGLYAVAPATLTGPYAPNPLSQIIDVYPEAVEQFLKRPATQVPWGKRVHHPDAMSLISVDTVFRSLAPFLKKAVDASPRATIHQDPL